MPKKKPSPDTLSLFDGMDGPPARKAEALPSPYVSNNRDRLHRWASRGIYFGSSSWKYPGWQGMVYNRTYPSKKAFERECLTEYSELFPTVCADFALYNFPTGSRCRSSTTAQRMISGCR